MPQALDEDGFARIRDVFIAAARRADRLGFELLEQHEAHGYLLHGYLLHTFVSPIANHRNDRYGGSFDNRMRFPLEVGAAMRAAWPRSKALGMRTSPARTGSRAG